MKHIPGLVRVILCLAERSVLSELTIGFAAALVDLPVWVMNVVPVQAKVDTLGAIYERGLIGTYHNWLVHSVFSCSLYLMKFSPFSFSSKF